MSTLSYEAISNAEDEVVGALRREGGVLSYPELVSLTKLPYDFLSRLLDRLKSEARVEISEEGSAIRLVRLAKPATRLARFLSL